MAINKKLIHFKSKEKFNQELANNNILDTSIVFIQDTKEIWTHGQLYSGDLNAIINDIPTKISELENDKGYLVKIILTQAEYDALEEKDDNALYVISDADDTENNNFVTESQLDSRGFLTQSDKTELNEYDQFLLSKIENIDLSNYLTIDESRKKNLVIATALTDLSDRIDKNELTTATAVNNLSDKIDTNDLNALTAVNNLSAKITTLESNLSTAMTKISELEQELAKTLVIN